MMVRDRVDCDELPLKHGGFKRGSLPPVMATSACSTGAGSKGSPANAAGPFAIKAELLYA